MQSRGILYMVWGEKSDTALDRSVESVKFYHPDLPVEIVRLPTTNASESYLEKARMLSLSPFSETLFLDADTVVLGKLDFGFEKSAKYGIACCICECPWAARYAPVPDESIEYNTGVIFFSRQSAPIFNLWESLAPTLDSASLFVKDGRLARMPFADQCSFAVAVERSGINPFVLPLNWNFRPQYYRSFFGPIKIWHSYADVDPAIRAINDHYRKDSSVIHFHEASSR